MTGWSYRRLLRNAKLKIARGKLKLYDYEAAWRTMFEARPGFPHIPSVFVGSDNSLRRGRKGVTIVNSTPQKFAQALRETTASVRDKPAEQRLVFVNAWNEWAEGNYLELDLKHGRGYLEALRTVLAECSSSPTDDAGERR